MFSDISSFVIGVYAYLYMHSFISSKICNFRIDFQVVSVWWSPTVTDDDDGGDDGDDDDDDDDAYDDYDENYHHDGMCVCGSNIQL